MAKKEQVYTIDKIDARLQGNVLHIEAEGTTRTGGWTDPELVATGEHRGEQQFQFVALPPSGPSTDAITPIRVKYESGPLRPPFPTAVRIFAETNELSAPIGRASDDAPPPSYGGGPKATA
ncbi:MAG TPA: hypothetical protein VF266_07020 [Thermoanaerobaculia bacterium]